MHRALALLCVLVVLALGVFAASPELHSKLHSSAQTVEDGCAVVLFASGVVLLAAALARPAAFVAWPEAARPVPVRIERDAPRYLLRPERGPPVA